MFYDHPIISATILITLLFTLAFVGGNQLGKYSCTKKTELMNLNCNYTFMTGCMIEIDGQWQPFNEYNTINLK